MKVITLTWFYTLLGIILRSQAFRLALDMKFITAICDITAKMVVPRSYINSVKWQYLGRMMSRLTITHLKTYINIFSLRPFKTFHSLIMQWNGSHCRVKERKYSMRQRMQFFLISLSSFCVILLTIFIWLLKGRYPALL